MAQSDGHHPVSGSLFEQPLAHRSSLNRKYRRSDPADSDAPSERVLRDVKGLGMLRKSGLPFFFRRVTRSVRWSVITTPPFATMIGPKVSTPETMEASRLKRRPWDQETCRDRNVKPPLRHDIDGAWNRVSADPTTPRRGDLAEQNVGRVDDCIGAPSSGAWAFAFGAGTRFGSVVVADHLEPGFKTAPICQPKWFLHCTARATSPPKLRERSPCGLVGVGVSIGHVDLMVLVKVAASGVVLVAVRRSLRGALGNGTMGVLVDHVVSPRMSVSKPARSGSRPVIGRLIDKRGRVDDHDRRIGFRPRILLG